MASLPFRVLLKPEKEETIESCLITAKERFT